MNEAMRNILTAHNKHGWTVQNPNDHPVTTTHDYMVCPCGYKSWVKKTAWAENGVILSADSYLHTASDGTATVVYVIDGERYYIENGAKMILPPLPNSVHGRYAAAKIAESGITQQVHDDFMLEGVFNGN